MEIRLPADKLRRLKTLLEGWRGKKACRKQELLSLIGSFSHACRAVQAGGSFLRRLIDLSSTAKNLDHLIRLSQSARSDILWWHHYCSVWSGTAIMFKPKKDRQDHDISITSDASGSWGCGAITGKKWFQLKWAGLGSTRACNITVKELMPIVLAAAVWGRAWSAKTVKAQCDNIAVVAMVNSGSSIESEAMHLLRCLAFLQAKHSLYIFATHIPGKLNIITQVCLIVSTGQSVTNQYTGRSARCGSGIQHICAKGTWQWTA